MERDFDADKIATLTGKAVQDDESFKSEGGFVPERDQFYFEMRQGDNTFLVGFKDLLVALRLLEDIGEIPPVGERWWDSISMLYVQEPPVVEYEVKK